MGIDPYAINAFLRTRTAALSRPADTGEFLRDLVPDVLDLLDVNGCAFALVRDGTYRLVTASDDVAAGLELTQERLQQGPGVAALADAHAVFVDQMATHAGAWPEFAEAAEAAGARSMAALPLRVDGELLGVLDVHSSRERTWSDQRGAELVAAACASLMVNLRCHQEAQERITQLQHALETRIVIEQAKGMLAQQGRIGVDAAFGLLRKYATDHRAPLREVAHAVVRLGLDVGAAQSPRGKGPQRSGSSTSSGKWSARMLADILDAIPAGVVWWDASMRLKFANTESLTRLSGTRAELTGRNLIEILGADAAAVYASVVTRAADGGAHEFDAPWWDHAQGASFRTSLVIPMGPGSELDGAFAFTFDNTARVNAQRAAQVDDAQNAVRRQRLEAVAHLNLDVLPSLGQCRELLAELPDATQPGSATLRRAQEFLAVARAALREAIDQLEHKMPDPADISGIGRDPAVAVARQLSADTKTTPRADRRSDPLPPSAELLRLLDALPAAVTFFGTNLVTIFANERAVVGFGRTARGEVIGRAEADLLDPEQHRVSEPFGAAALKGEPQHFLRTVPSPDGAVRHLQIDYVGAMADGVTGAVGMAVDVTEQVRAETAARRSRARAEQIAERERVAGELQDVVMRRLEAVTTLLSRPPTEQTVPRVLAYVDDAMSDLRLSVNGLLGLSGALGGLIAACRRTIRDTAAGFDREPVLVHVGPVEWVSVPLTNDVVETLRETLNRVAEAGETGEVAVELRSTSDALELTVRSAGPPWRSGELGAMSARAQRHGGQVSIAETDIGTVLVWTARQDAQTVG